MSNVASTPTQLGRRIRQLRVSAGLSQEDLAEPEYTAAYISHLEHGKRQASDRALAHIASRLGLTLEQLVSGRDPNDDLRLELDIQQAIARIHAGDVAEGRSILDRCKTEAQESGHREALLRALQGLGLARLRLGDLEAAAAAYTEAGDMAAESGADALTSALVGQARCFFQKGEVRDAVHMLESHLIDLRSSSAASPASLLEVYAALIPAYFELGLVDRAKDAVVRASRLASEVEDPELLACLYINRAGFSLSQGDRREALASLALAEDIFRGLSWYAEQVKVALAKAMVHVDAGDLQKAEALLSETLGDEDKLSAPDRARLLTQLATVRRAQGRPEEALTLARRAQRVAGSSVAIEAAEASREAALCALELGDSATGIKNLRRAVKLFRSAGHRQESANTAVLLGDHLRDSGDAAAAMVAYREGLV